MSVTLTDKLAELRKVFEAGTAGDRRVESGAHCDHVVIDANYLDDDPPNYLAAVYGEGDARAIAAGTCGQDGVLVALVDIARECERIIATHQPTCHHPGSCTFTPLEDLMDDLAKALGVTK